MDKLLQVLSNQSNRNAQFKTVVTLNLNGKQYLFTGIARRDYLIKVGKEGFGDPIFQPEGYQQTSLNCRLNQISHRERQHNNSSAFENEVSYQI
jgi:XTP/dITP diphosphohydrolase